MDLRIEQGDILEADADVAAFKYARAFYGADSSAALRLEAAGLHRRAFIPGVDGYKIVRTLGALRPALALFVDTAPQVGFRYGTVREFSSKVLRIVGEEQPEVRRIAMTLHGPGFGLDELQAWLSLVAGMHDVVDLEPYSKTRSTLRAEKSVRFSTYLANLDVAVVEQSPDRAKLLASSLIERIPELPSLAFVGQEGSSWVFHFDVFPGSAEEAAVLSSSIEEKRRLFVAFPFELRDVFRFGIQGPAHRENLLCEHMGEQPYTGDVLARVKQQIETASAMVAVLTGKNPNVYLELGFAWGCDTPAVLVAHESEELPFDVRGQRCLIYKDISDLEDKLSVELSELRADGAF